MKKQNWEKEFDNRFFVKKEHGIDVVDEIQAKVYKEFIQSTINKEVKETLKRIEKAVKTRSILKIEEALEQELLGDKK